MAESLSQVLEKIEEVRAEFRKNQEQLEEKLMLGISEVFKVHIASLDSPDFSPNEIVSPNSNSNITENLNFSTLEIEPFQFPEFPEVDSSYLVDLKAEITLEVDFSSSIELLSNHRIEEEGKSTEIAQFQTEQQLQQGEANEKLMLLLEFRTLIYDTGQINYGGRNAPFERPIDEKSDFQETWDSISTDTGQIYPQIDKKLDNIFDIIGLIDINRCIDVGNGICVLTESEIQCHRKVIPVLVGIICTNKASNTVGFVLHDVMCYRNDHHNTLIASLLVYDIANFLVYDTGQTNIYRDEKLLNIGIGLAFGIAYVLWLGLIFNDTVIEIRLTVAVSYMAYFTAQEGFNVSGILAVMALGMFYAAAARTAFKGEGQKSLHHFWGMVAYIANMLVFILSGVVIAESAPASDVILRNQGPSWGSICFCAIIPVYSCWNDVSIFAIFRLWFGLEGSCYSRMDRFAGCCCIVTLTIS